MGILTRTSGRALLAGIAAGATVASIQAVKRSKYAADLERTNHKGDTVSLAEGPGVTIGATAGAVAGAKSSGYAVAAATAGLVSGAAGLYDDVADTQGQKEKGLKGHLGALTRGEVTSGAVKIASIGAAGFTAALIVDATEPRQRGWKRFVNTCLGAGVIAGSANLLNLFDLRPGRALKVASVVGTLLSRQPGPDAPSTAVSAANTASAAVTSASAAMPEDLEGKTMLGDCGANALGALLGLAFVARSGPAARAAALTGIASLTLASEKVSFTQVIADTPVLRELDELGRKNSSS
ncbi:hypothetical protein [Natronoglycomyces albus]|uniref:Uncharacterized protein n=1 Tax=Natronoglycomyces albus TaxID=2811108 RepID=A0A895XQT3_9ACTN|nr:hypothetical protein [Natronoglycomyces albus]QSB03918.1 hypothetical protein JQS30_08775 [Natronoglycomyces albus]